MRGLLTKLVGLDSSATRGLRVIEFFDQLVLHNADLEAVTRATAVLAERTAGAILDDHSQACTVAPKGTVLPTTGPSSFSLVKEVVVDRQTVGRVWLENTTPGEFHEWDELIIERMAIAIATLWARKQDNQPQLGLAHPATLHVLINASTSESEAARAARLLGFNVGATVRVIAVEGTARVQEGVAELRTIVANTCTGRVVGAAMSSTLGVVVAATDSTPEGTAPAGMAVCVGPSRPVEHCSSAWLMAREGARFSALGGLWPRWNTTERLGCALAFTDLDPGQVSQLADVQAIARIAGSKSGATDIKLIDTYCWMPSIRETATSLHMHHSSVNYRITTLTAALGYNVRTSEGRYRLRTALTFWQLHVK